MEHHYGGGRRYSPVPATYGCPIMHAALSTVRKSLPSREGTGAHCDDGGFD
jgi:hypothetical protein